MNNISSDISLEIPHHVGIILDGNRRWAKRRGLPSLEGHRRGYQNLKTIARHALDMGVSYLSAFIFSTENWKRSKEEVDYLMDLAKNIIENDAQELIKEGIKVVMVGSRKGVRQDILDAIDRLEAKTVKNHRGTLALCFNYGGHQEIVDAVSQIVRKGMKADDITSQDISDHLYAADVPPIDLIIRTSGEQRLSNFMMWRAAYAELYFIDKQWPAFNKKDFDDAIAVFGSRLRRFGG